MSEEEIPSSDFIDVILPLALPKPYTYSITASEAAVLKPGFRVAVPFGKQKIYTAIVTKVHRVAPQTYTPKPIALILDERPTITLVQLEFWKWMATYYMCPMGAILKAALPGPLLLESETILIKKEVAAVEVLEQLTDDQYLIYEALSQKSLSVNEIMQITDRKTVMPLLQQMLQLGLLEMHQYLNEKYTPKWVRYVRLAPAFHPEGAEQQVFDQLQRSPKQTQIILALFQESLNKETWHKLSRIKALAQATSGQIKILIDKAILEETKLQEDRVLIAHPKEEEAAKTLSEAQTQAFDGIKAAFENKATVLFEGVTASGKTEVYIQLINAYLEAGKQVLYLLPEISLTSQIVSRLTARFKNRIGVYHSKFTPNERTEVWDQVLQEKEQSQLIIGARSAVLLPFQNLGLIIVDEEHETSYKQFDPAPRYHARDSAIYLAHQMQAKVLLGSATPAVETAENVRSGKFGWVQLQERFGGIALPKITLLDLKEAHRKKQMKGVFSEPLLNAMKAALAAEKQIIIFQNRRGYAPIAECFSCGYTPQCTQCDVSLTYHQTNNQLRCHYCGYHIAMPQQCHSCGMPTMDTKGVGTQQIQEQIENLFPEVAVGRMDWDSTRGKWDFDKIIAAFSQQEIQILVGTQMVVKGLDFKNVVLVGVINADHLLNFPDFRAHERSFQMLCQVAGRAGRFGKQGNVIIQTYQPESPVLRQVVHHNYETFFKEQMKERFEYQYPPYNRLIQITFKNKNMDALNKGADWFSNVLKQSYSGTILGPVFPAVARVRNLYIKQLLIKSNDSIQVSQLKQLIERIHMSFSAVGSFRSIRVNIDVDPY